MDLNKLKNTDPKQIIAGVILVGMLPLLVVWYKARKGEKTTNQPEEISMQATNSQYETKLAAFKAKQKEQRELSGQRLVTSDQMDTFSTQDSAKEVQLESVKERSVIVPDVQEQPVIAVQKKAAPVTKTKPTSPKSTNQAAANLRNTVAQEQQPKEEIPMVSAQMEQERRRQEMMAGWNRNQNQPSIAGKTYKGMIHGTQELASGQIAQLRTKEEMRIGNITIPVNTLISGKVRIVSGRLMIDVSSVRLRNEIHAIAMSVYGSDGQPGLPTALDITDNAINKELTEEAISQVGRRTGVIGSIASGVATAVTRDKNQKVKLIDAQTIYFKVNVR